MAKKTLSEELERGARDSFAFLRGVINNKEEKSSDRMAAVKLLLDNWKDSREAGESSFTVLFQDIPKEYCE